MVVFMNDGSLHTFHIPVLGLAYSIDTPLKVARFGISSVISIVEDDLIETMRQFHSENNGDDYQHIPKADPDHRAKRITAYLDLIGRTVQKQLEDMRSLPFEKGSDINKYFELLPDTSAAKQLYNEMLSVPDKVTKELLQEQLRRLVHPGSIDVNIMAKVDYLEYDKTGAQMPQEYSTALSALRGFADSSLRSSVVFSAGYNPKLFSYLENFPDFFPDEEGELRKKIIIKVSDFRSAMVQGKLLAKRGLWVSEFRIESGLNCGGHAFPTNGLLLGPIVEEFKNNRVALANELFDLCLGSGRGYVQQPPMKISVQGGVGTSQEHEFLRQYYHIDSVGWGSPFLLVPEATNVDDETLQQLATAEQSDYYLSEASPLGVPFNNFRKSSSEQQRKVRIENNRPGSPCYKKYLSSNTEFTEQPICTASRKYQHLKIAELKEAATNDEMLREELNKLTEKDCLCEGLVAPALLKNKLPLSHGLKAVTICPGPNLAYFSGIFSLSQMVSHIYGRCNILNAVPRSNMFINELGMYIDYLQNEIRNVVNEITAKKLKGLETFKQNLNDGIDYYLRLLSEMPHSGENGIRNFRSDLGDMRGKLSLVKLPAFAKPV